MVNCSTEIVLEMTSALFILNSRESLGRRHRPAGTSNCWRGECTRNPSCHSSLWSGSSKSLIAPLGRRAWSSVPADSCLLRNRNAVLLASWNHRTAPLLSPGRNATGVSVCGLDPRGSILLATQCSKRERNVIRKEETAATGGKPGLRVPFGWGGKPITQPFLHVSVTLVCRQLPHGAWSSCNAAVYSSDIGFRPKGQHGESPGRPLADRMKATEKSA